MASEGHSLKVAEWLTAAEALALASGSETAREIEWRASSLAARTDRIGEAIACGRIAERAKVVAEASASLLIALRVYADSEEAAKVLDRDAAPEQVTT